MPIYVYFGIGKSRQRTETNGNVWKRQRIHLYYSCFVFSLLLFYHRFAESFFARHESLSPQFHWISLFTYFRVTLSLRYLPQWIQSFSVWTLDNIIKLCSFFNRFLFNFWPTLPFESLVLKLEFVVPFSSYSKLNSTPCLPTYLDT